MSSASGIGSWPGDDMRTALRVVRDAGDRLAGTEVAIGHPATFVPYLPEMPDRGPGADLLGRTAGILVELPVDLQPSGWRLVDRPGRDVERTQRLWSRDLDDLAEAFEGYAGELTIGVAGPWTLAAHVRLGRGERVLADEGATRDLRQSLAAGVVDVLGRVRRALPGSNIVVRLDEPSLPDVLSGALSTSSGYGRLRAVDPEEVRRGLAEVIEAARATASAVAVHCCAARPPLPLLRSCGADAVSLDTSLLGAAGWESVAATVEAGVGVWLGAAPTMTLIDGQSSAQDAAVLRGGHAAVVGPLVSRWRDLGLPMRRLADVTITPRCGLAGTSPQYARAVHTLLADCAKELTYRAWQDE